jgi:predicted glutamine amidotransferase
MCKVMIMTGIQKSDLALKFMQSVAQNMSFGNNDGIGYSAINSNNELFSEKWHNNHFFMNTDKVIDQLTLDALMPYKDRLPALNKNYQSYGNVTRNDIKTVTMHTRFATCGKTFENTHPFIDNEISLIHNGVINNSTTLTNKISTCDSETALQVYIKDQINLQVNKEHLQSFLDQLKGYWAFGILAKNQEGIYNLDVVRDGASLYWTYIPEIGRDCMIFATTQEIIETGIKSLDLPKRDKIHFLTEHTYIRFNALTGQIIESLELKESKLNKPVYINYSKNTSYNNYSSYDKYSDSFDEYYQEMYEKNRKAATNFLGEDIEDIYEGYKTTSVGDDLDIESFYDTEIPLLQRLKVYDELMASTYHDLLESYTPKTISFITKNEERGTISFDDVLDMIDAYAESGRLSDMSKVYSLRKKA